MLPRNLDLDVLFARAEPDRWRALVDADLKGAPFEKKLVTHTYEGVRIQPLYTRADAGTAWERFEASGTGTMTRGGRPLGCAVSGWDIRQECADPDPDALNAAALEALRGGAGSLLLRLDAAAREGRDALDPRGAVLTARDGSAIHSVDDLDRALKGVHLEMISVALEAGAAFMPAAAMLAALWERRGVKPAEARGFFQADPLAVLARDGELPCSFARALELLGELAAWTGESYPGVRAVRAGTAPYHHAGATATQDLAFSMSTAVAYLRAMEASGLDLERAAGQVLFSYSVGTNVFLAIAKLRAARRLWARVIESCGGSPASRRMLMHARPSRRVMTTRDPWVNILRNTACVFAAGVGGADAVTSTPFDVTLGQPSDQARRLALNTHHILMEESRLHQVNDLAGGSWCVERLTNELAEKAWVIFQAIESRGGMAAALTSGWVHEQIDQALQPRLRNLATRKEVIVGVSDFPNLAEHPPRPTPVDRAAILTAARDRLKGRRGSAPPAEKPRAGARAPWALEQATRGAPMGEIARPLFESGAAPTFLEQAVHVHSYAEPFERIREAADHLLEQTGVRPRVFMLTLGAAAQRLARENYCRNLLEAGGFEVVTCGAGAPEHEIAESFRAAATHAALICGPDEAYPSGVAPLAGLLRRAGARRIVLAGNPGADEAAYRAAGVDLFVFVRCDVVAVLTDLLSEEGAAL